MSLKKGDKFGVIDIGSNTVRGVVYYSNTLKTKSGNAAYRSNILEETSEGVLSYNGIESLVHKIEKSLDYFAKNGAFKAYAFATSAMRDVTNFDEVHSHVLAKTGVSIDLISGEKEAEYDYLAIAGETKGRSGIAVDLGGGSAQIVVFDERGVTEAESFPIGVKRVRNGFCRGVIPDAAELSKIDEHIKSILSKIKGKSREIWFMGGTAKAVSGAVEAVLFKRSIITADLEELYGSVCESTSLLRRLFGRRYDTIPVGIWVMKAIAESFGSEAIHISRAGVRDGYVAALFKGKDGRADT